MPVTVTVTDTTTNPPTSHSYYTVWQGAAGTNNAGYTVLDLSQFIGSNSTFPFQPGEDLQLIIRESLPNTANFNCSVQAVPFFMAQYTDVDGAGAGLMGPYLPLVDYPSLTQGVLPQPALTQASQLPNPAYCGKLPAMAPFLNSPTAANTVAWPTYWPGTGNWPLPLNCGTATSVPQAAPLFVASLVATEEYTACPIPGPACNSVIALSDQTDAFTNPTAPPLPITVVGQGFGYLPQILGSAQILPFAGRASSLVAETGASLLEIRDYPSATGVAWDTASNPDCQVYIANWTDSSISLHVNLPTGTTDHYGVALSPLSDMSPLTFFPNSRNTTTQACPVANGDTVKITLVNAQGGGAPASICVLVGTPGPKDCPNQ